MNLVMPKPVVHRFRLVLAMSLIFHAGCQAPVRTLEWQSDIRPQAIAALEAGRCDVFFDLVWPYTRSGQPEATLLLASAIYSRGLTPPGAGKDVLSRLRGVMSGYAVAARTGEPHAVEMLGALLQADLFEEGGGRQHAACLETNPDKSACVDEALRSDLFPHFGQWADEIEAIGNAGDIAVCRQPVEAQKLSDEDFQIRPSKPSK